MKGTVVQYLPKRTPEMARNPLSALPEQFHGTALEGFALSPAIPEDMVFADLFKGFYDDAGGNIVLALLTSLFTALWSMLFVIPGIVKAYAYSQVFYIKADHPDYDWKACINESKRMMQGHKGELFALDLSFSGWYIVGALCLGIGELWVAPYVEAAKAHFYQNLLILEGARQTSDTPAEPWNGMQPEA